MRGRNSPRDVLSSQLTRPLWKTETCTVCWLSATVANVRLLTVGTVCPLHDSQHGLSADHNRCEDVAVQSCYYC